MSAIVGHSGPLSVSVAMCTRDGAAHLGSQLTSILAQTRLIDEVIISDDASTDGTLDMVRDIWAGVEGSCPRLVIRHNEVPLGVVKNFEQAVSACTSDIIVLSDQDDVWAPDRIEREVARLVERPELLLVHSDARLVDAGGALLGSSLFAALEVSPQDLTSIHSGEAFGVFLRRNLATGATIAFRSELLRWTLPFPDDWVHDEWLAAIAAASERLDVIESQLIDYRQHDSNQIGVAAPTLGFKIARVLTAEPGRNERIAQRFEELRARLNAAGVPVSANHRELLDAKIAHEFARSAFPPRRIRRWPAVLREARKGGYARFASRGRFDIIRDLLQPRPLTTTQRDATTS